MKPRTPLTSLAKILTLALNLFLVSSLVGAASAQEKKVDKIGTVNMQKLVGQYYKSAEIQKTFKTYEKSIIAKDKIRVDEIKVIIEEARNLQKKGEDPSLNREKKAVHLRDSSMKQQEAQARQRDRKAWLERKQSALREKASIEFAALRQEIMEQVQAVGEEQGFDFIFDRSGASGAGVPILSYTKDATDLTGLLLERINKDAPEAEDTPEAEDSPEEVTPPE